MQLVTEMGAEGARASGGESERVAGRYELIERIAQGGMGEVFVARELATVDGVLALKRLLPAAHEARRRCFAPSTTRSRASSTRSSSRCTTSASTRICPYYTMELLDGHDLRECAAGRLRGGLPHPARRGLLARAAARAAPAAPRREPAQRAAHQQRRVQADRLRHHGAVRRRRPTWRARRPFISPEAWEGARARSARRSLLAGRARVLAVQPPPAGQRALARPRPRPARARRRCCARSRSDIPPELEELVMSLLELDPSQRPSSAHGGDRAALGDRRAARAATSPLLARSAPRQLALRRAEARAGRARKSCSQRALRVQRRRRSWWRAPRARGKTRFLQEVSLLAQTQGLLGGARVRARARRGAARGARAVSRPAARRARGVRAARRAPSASCCASFDWQRRAAARRGSPSETRAQLAVGAGRLLSRWSRDSRPLARAGGRSRPGRRVLGRPSWPRSRRMAETLPLLVRRQLRARRAQRRAPLARCASRERARRSSWPTLDEKRDARAGLGPVRTRAATASGWSSFLYRDAHGNPALTMELCRLLARARRDPLRRRRFVLPESEIREQLPPATARSASRCGSRGSARPRASWPS